jgi:hypothetical protein
LFIPLFSFVSSIILLFSFISPIIPLFPLHHSLVLHISSMCIYILGTSSFLSKNKSHCFYSAIGLKPGPRKLQNSKRKGSPLSKYYGMKKAFG